MRFFAAVLLLIPLSAAADSWGWEWSGDPDTIDAFVLYADGREVARVDDPSARVLEFSGEAGPRYTLRACSAVACSAESDSVVIPVAPQNLRVTIQVTLP